MIKALFTDFDGVIRHWNNQSVFHVEEKLGLSRGFLFQHAFTDKLLLPTITGFRSHDEWLDRIEGNIRDKTNRDIAQKLMTAWSKADYLIDYDLLDNYRRLLPEAKLVLVTNATDKLSNDLINSGLDDSFDVIINSSEIGFAKPDPCFYKKTMAFVDVSTSDILFVDDSMTNVQNAVDFGFKGIHFGSRSNFLSDMEVLVKNN